MAKGEASYEFDPFKETGIEVPQRNRRQAAEAAAEYVKEQILLYTSKSQTSVEGGRWKTTLEEPYKTEKRKQGGSNKANLELTGEMLDALQSRVLRGGKVLVEISESDQLGKAEGHLLGSYGKSEDADKAREFMPHRRGQHLRKEIIQGLKEILEEYKEE